MDGPKTVAGSGKNKANKKKKKQRSQFLPHSKELAEKHDLGKITDRPPHIYDLVKITRRSAAPECHPLE